MLAFVAGIAVVEAASFNLTLVTTGSLKGTLAPLNSTTGKACEINGTLLADHVECTGGVARRAAYVRSLREARSNNVLVLDSGYTVFGSVEEKVGCRIMRIITISSWG
jgi:2',3'-cyclic-nucleotide 2'-phosphodiesterase (5'-nucleotidase family)